MIPIYGAAVIGGGFYGCEIALRLRDFFPRVVLLEQEADLLRRASFNNQARVHNGYHYPRSLLTALRSRASFPRFVSEYQDCIDRGFAKYYAIPRKFSKITAEQFRLFCRRIGASVARADGAIRQHFNPDLVEEVFAVEECAFNADRLRERLWDRLRRRDVEVRLQTRVVKVEPGPALRLQCTSPDGDDTVQADHVFVCAYSQLNHVLRSSGLPAIPLKHEFTEMALVEAPPALHGVGVTVMCGPFFSFMPFPPRGLHTLSHVRYTPHAAWQDGPEGCDGGEKGTGPLNAKGPVPFSPPRSNFAAMLRDVCRYLPVMAEARYVDSLWEVKTVLPQSESDDSRPILFKRHFGLDNVHCVLGAKIDNIYDALEEVGALLQQRKVAG